VRQVSRALAKLYDDILRPAGLQTSQLTLLVAVVRFGERGAKISALADALVMDRTTLTRNLAPPERDGLLRVALSPEDARLRVVFLTREGERAIERAYPLWATAQKQVHKLLGSSETADLRQRLAELLTALG
jgi:DNA-binding MarR family transcriptional regulator